MSISSSVGAGPVMNRYRIAGHHGRSAQAGQGEESMGLILATNSQNLGMSDWDLERNRSLREPQATDEVGLSCGSCLSGFGAWFFRLFDWTGMDNPRLVEAPQPANIPLIPVLTIARRRLQKNEIPHELERRDALMPDEQAHLFFPADDDRKTRDEARALFQTYPQIAQFLWSQFRSAHRAETAEAGAQRLARVQHCTRDQIREIGEGNAWKVQAFEDSL